MKKLLAVILIIILAVPAVALAVDGDSPFYGRWVGCEHHTITHYDTTLHYMRITRYKTCEYYVFNLFEGGGVGTGKLDKTDIYSDRWEIVENHLRIPTSGISYVDVYYDSKTDTLYTENPKVTYVRVP